VVTPSIHPCAECGTEATLSFAYLDQAGEPTRQLPICSRCRELKSLKFFAWVSGCIALCIGVVAIPAFIIDATLDPATQRRIVGPIVGALMLLGVVPLWLGLRRRQRAFHRFFSVVRHTAAVDPAGPYRSASPPSGALPARPITFAVGLLVSLAFFTVGVTQYMRLGEAERHGGTIRDHWLIILVYDVGGRGAVLGLFVILGIVVLALAIGGLRSALQRT
jgi:hypothetical protein